MIGWLLGTSVGRTLSSAGAIILALASVYLLGRKQALQSQKDRDNARILNEMRRQKEIQNDVESMDSDGLRDALSEFVRE